MTIHTSQISDNCALAAAVNYSSYLIYTQAVSYSSRTQVHLTHNLNFKVIAETDGAAFDAQQNAKKLFECAEFNRHVLRAAFSAHTHAHTQTCSLRLFSFFFLFFPQ